jgi:hypothetical protein
MWKNFGDHSFKRSMQFELDNIWQPKVTRWGGTRVEPFSSRLVHCLHDESPARPWYLTHAQMQAAPEEKQAFASIQSAVLELGCPVLDLRECRSRRKHGLSEGL